MQCIHSGSTMLNLALTGMPTAGWPLGRSSNIVGDKSTGKTLLAIEAASMFLGAPPKGIDYPHVRYLEGEEAFDPDYAAALGLPVEQVTLKPLNTIEQLYTELEDVCKVKAKSHGNLVIVDSLDSIDAQAELEKSLDEGTYDMGKQKQLGKIFRRLVKPMADSNTHLMIISQIRHNITTMPFSPKWRRSGGKALDFYCTHIVWLHEVKKLKSKATSLVYGVNINAKVNKNKVGPPFREATFPLLFTFGIDDVISLINFLSGTEVPMDFRIVKQSGGYYSLPGDDEKFTLVNLISVIESDSEIYLSLVANAQMVWTFFEEAIKVHRRSKVELLTGQVSSEPDQGAPEQPVQRHGFEAPGAK